MSSEFLTFDHPIFGMDRIESYNSNAPQVWAHLLYWKHKEITQYVVASYTRPCITDSVQRVEIANMAIAERLCKGETPLAQNATDEPSMQAISCIVGTKGSSKPHPIIKPQKDASLELNNPQALQLLDFSCAISLEGEKAIKDTLNELCADWYLLFSGASYHAIVDNRVDVSRLAWHLGGFLGRISSLSKNDFIREMGCLLADSMMSNSASSYGLQYGTQAMFSKVFDEAKARFDNYEHFSRETILDWGHLCYTTRDIALFMEGNSPGAGYLRLGEKDKFMAPVLVDHSSN